MGKFATFSATGIVGTGAVLTGAYALGAFGNSNDIVPSSANAFKSSNGGTCVQSLFPGVLKIEDGSKALGDPPPVEPFQDDASSYKGCVMVSWERFKPKVDEKNKWSGVLRFVWTLSRENLGLIAYSNIFVYVDEKKSESSFYLISKNGNSVWDVASKREELNVTLNYDQIPKSLDSLKVGSLWGLAQDYEKGGLIKKDDSNTNNSIAGKVHLKWVSDDQKNEKNWSSNFDVWVEQIFGNEFKDIVDKFVDNTKGEWSNI